MSEWNLVESYTLEALAEEGLTPEELQQRWVNVADDMALIPERNVRVSKQGDLIRVEVSQELLDCMRGC